MQYSEYKSQVEAYWIKLPLGWGGFGGNENRYPEYADLGHPGSGVRRVYTDYDVRLAVSWVRVHELTGKQSKTFADMGLKAAQLLTLWEFGWVVMSDRYVYWTDVPTERVFDKGAVCIPVQ